MNEIELIEVINEIKNRSKIIGLVGDHGVGKTRLLLTLMNYKLYCDNSCLFIDLANSVYDNIPANIISNKNNSNVHIIHNLDRYEDIEKYTNHHMIDKNKKLSVFIDSFDIFSKKMRPQKFNNFLKHLIESNDQIDKIYFTESKIYKDNYQIKYDGIQPIELAVSVKDEKNTLKMNNNLLTIKNLSIKFNNTDTEWKSTIRKSKLNNIVNQN